MELKSRKTKTEACNHDWVRGPFWLLVSVATIDELKLYPQSNLINVEHCTKCGIIRLPEDERKYIGKNRPERL